MITPTQVTFQRFARCDRQYLNTVLNRLARDDLITCFQIDYCACKFFQRAGYERTQ
uniref:Uncharacterized protein n=1 Tax=Siphoviridae sp. ctcfw7 TaxID=2826394 RepID=A0A8S5MG97_9CAUD|nr:MAG TPA: hypothetical protein [Siphoviridae sp. ctcfw7]